METTLDLHTPGAKDDGAKLKPMLVLLPFAPAIRLALATRKPTEAGTALLAGFGGEALDLTERMDAGLSVAVFIRELYGAPGAATGIVRVGTFGAAKYSPNGWRLVENGLARYADAALRHLLAIHDFGVHALDDESGIEHIHHLLWNLLAYETRRLDQQENPRRVP